MQSIAGQTRPLLSVSQVAEPKPISAPRQPRGSAVPILHLCSACGRGYPLAGRSTGKCPDCQRAYERIKSRRRRATSTAVHVRDSREWQHVRALARARDGGCVYRYQGGCAGALAVHHRVPLKQGGTNHLSNLETLCRVHHEQAEH